MYFPKERVSLCLCTVTVVSKKRVLAIGTSTSINVRVMLLNWLGGTSLKLRRIETSNKWALDDPAFAMILIGLLSVMGLLYGISYSKGVSGTFMVILHMVFVDFLLVGCIVATATW